MRSHLLSALEKKVGYEKRRVQPIMKKAKKVKVKLYCICRLPDDG